MREVQDSTGPLQADGDFYSPTSPDHLIEAVPLIW